MQTVNDERYAVVVNGEEQYSMWPVDQDVPLGWRVAAFKGSCTECLAYIARIWTDMRPLSVRHHLGEQP
jgi:MbtH protein